MPLPDFCHDPTGLEILALARANPREIVHRVILADWLDGLGDKMAGKFARILRKSMGTNRLLAVKERYAERLHPLVGFRRGWPHARQFDQTDPVAVAWLSTPDVIQLAPGNFIELVRVPVVEGPRDFPAMALRRYKYGADLPMRVPQRLGRYSLAKTVLTKRQWYAHLGKKLPSGQNPDHPATGIPAEKAREFCRGLSKAAGRKVRLPNAMEWRIACWNTENVERIKRLEKDKDEVRRMGWTRNNTPRTAFTRGSYIRQEVCTRKPNPLGFFDMCGLVSEWCQDSLIGDDDLYEVSATCLPYWDINLIGSAPWCWDAPWSGGIRILVEEE